MKVLIDLYARLGVKLYPFRWILLMAIFLPFFAWSAISAAILMLAALWSMLLLSTVLVYGPIKSFEGSVIWSDGVRPIAWLFILLFSLCVLAGSVVILYGIIQSS